MIVLWRFLQTTNYQSQTNQGFARKEAMLFDIKATKITLTEGILSAVERQLKTLDAKVERFGTSVTGRVEVCKTTAHHKKGDVFHAEIIIRLPGKSVFAEAQDSDLYAAIGEARKEAERQIMEHKGKREASVLRGAREAKRRVRRLPGEPRRHGGRILNEGA
jgi:putative sigma-54 modulation protein